MRQEPAVRGYAITHPPGAVEPPQPPGWNQLVYAVTGVATVHTTEGTWVVPPHRAVWVPDGRRHRMVFVARTSVRNLYVRPRLWSLPDRCQAVEVPPLLRELLVHTVLAAPLYEDDPKAMRLIGVVGDLLESLPVAPLQLPFPSDGRARAVADALLADPAATCPVEELARRAGAARRTIERCFIRETGMSLGAWRRRMRVLEGLRLLAAGCSVTETAAKVGYGTPSAFGAMFVRETGISPARYFD